MSDPAAAWLASMIRHGETAIVLRTQGYGWREISDELHLGDVATAQRAAALFLAADYQPRQTHGEGAGHAHAATVTDASPESPRVAVAAG